MSKNKDGVMKLIKKQWYTGGFFLIVAGVTLKTIPLALMNYNNTSSVSTYPDIGIILGYICGLSGIACVFCGLFEKETV